MLPTQCGSQQCMFKVTQHCVVKSVRLQASKNTCIETFRTCSSAGFCPASVELYLCAGTSQSGLPSSENVTQELANEVQRAEKKTEGSTESSHSQTSVVTVPGRKAVIVPVRVFRDEQVTI